MSPKLTDAKNPASESRLRVRRRARLLQVAEATFLRGGYSAATMDQIAAEAGVSRQTLYNYFRDKEALFTALASEWRGAFGGMVEQLIGAIEALDASPEAAARLREGIAAALEEMEQRHYAGMVRLMVEISQTAPGLAAIVREALGETGLDAMANALQRAIAGKQLRSVDATATATIFGEALAGYLLFGSILAADGESLTAGRLATTLADMLVRTLVEPQ